MIGIIYSKYYLLRGSLFPKEDDMAEWSSASGTEFSPALTKRLNTFFDRLAES